MHEDPTRHMPEQEPRGDGEGQGGGGLSGRTKFLIGALVAVIAGLVIAVVLIAGSDNGKQSTTTASVPTITATLTEAPTTAVTTLTPPPQTVTPPPQTVTTATTVTQTVTTATAP